VKTCKNTQRSNVTEDKQKVTAGKQCHKISESIEMTRDWIEIKLNDKNQLRGI
jgi:hypothetical protein